MSRDIGQYKIFNEIGKGSFGKVYKGIDKLTGEEVALKFIEKREKRSRELKNLRDENELLKRINHPNVICLKDVIETQKEIIIVTDYAGRDLSGVIEEVKKFSFEKCKELSIQILNAMLYLSENRITHRDLKPQNILIKNNHIKICDFGFAKKLSASTNFMQSMKGTPLYLAPEIVKETKYTEKVDIWSFGCIIYELFTGRTPYYANTYHKLVPMILLQHVQYPKEMPAEMKDLISSMLQKNPSARPNWKELKEHPFFKQPEILRERLENNMREMKEVVSMESIDCQILDIELRREENKENELNKNQHLEESKVIQKINNEEEIKGYLEEFKNIYTDLVNTAIDQNNLRSDVIFLHKIKTIFHERTQENDLITNELLETVFNILSHLIKLKRTFSTTERQPENLTSEEDDVTKNEALIIGLLCVAKVEKNYEMLEKELRMICLLVKRSFNGFAINAEIDEEITEFITEILLENPEKIPIECVRNGLTIIGTFVNQAVMTINNSFMYFERIAEDNLLGKIANIFKKTEQHSIVLECLKQSIHPIRDVPSMNGNHLHHILQAKIEKTFDKIKEQVSEGLLKTDFFSEKSPVEVYGEKSAHLVDYCEVLLECLGSSAEIRKEFLKYTYWPELLKLKRTKSFLFAYNEIFLSKESQSIISNEIMNEVTRESQENKLINILILKASCGRLKKILTRMEKQNIEGFLHYKKHLLQKVPEHLVIEEEIKLKCIKEVYGTLETASTKFDQPLIETYYQLAKEFTIDEKSDEESRELEQNIFKSICKTTAPFKPNSKSLYCLMSLFTESENLKPLRTEKTVQTFFYECISDFLKKEDFEYFEIDFEEKFIPEFTFKLIKCLNCLIDFEEPGAKGPGCLSLLAVGLSKEIQTSSFYRFMFIDELSEEEFYESLKYIGRIITKTIPITSELTNFLGVKVVPMCRRYLSTINEKLIIEICIFLSQIARDNSEFNNEILNTKIISKLREWLADETLSEGAKEKILYLIGNLAKRSEFFFQEFESNKVLNGVAYCLEKHYSNTKIFKNTIYSVGNISFYSQKELYFFNGRFYREIEPMISYFAKAFEHKDPHLQSNLISTVSNLMRYSNIYLKDLIKTGMIGNILKIACYSNEIDQVIANLLMSLIKKILPYDEFYKEFGYKELKIIYQRRQQFGGDGNETIKKIRDVLLKSGNELV